MMIRSMVALAAMVVGPAAFAGNCSFGQCSAVQVSVPQVAVQTFVPQVAVSSFSVPIQVQQVPIQVQQVPVQVQTVVQQVPQVVVQNVRRCGSSVNVNVGRRGIFPLFGRRNNVNIRVR